MDFFARQREAQRATSLLLFSFPAVVLCMLASIYFATEWILRLCGDSVSWDHSQVSLWTMLVSGATILVAAVVRTVSLRSGGGTRVASLLGARTVVRNTKDLAEIQLLNVVEEMAIASGLPMPRVFVLHRETGINAFAAGWGTADAVVAVTRGCLDRLSRDELQGVVAHEFSHVLNGDTRLNMRLMGLAFGIVCIATAGRILLRLASEGPRSRSSNQKSDPMALLAMAGFALLAIGSIGLLFARILQASVSRQREHLADAAAVQYTRNPRGIAMALAKLGNDGSRISAPRTAEARHLFFAAATKDFIAGLRSTHPPIADRIEHILPGTKQHLEGRDLVGAVAVQTLSALHQEAAAAHEPLPRSRSTTERIVATAGTLSSAGVLAAHRVLDSAPAALLGATRSPAGARCLTLAALLDPDPGVRDTQLRQLEEDGEDRSTIAELAHQLDGAQAPGRLLLFEISLPALQSLTFTEREKLQKQARKTLGSERSPSVFKLLLVQLLAKYAPARRVRVAPAAARKLKALLPHATLCLGCIAWLEATDEKAALGAFTSATDALGIPLAMPARSAATLDRLGGAIILLDRLAAIDKRRMLLACGRAAAADGILGPEEVELVRALAAHWGCPIPPDLSA